MRYYAERGEGLSRSADDEDEQHTTATSRDKHEEM